MNGPHVAKLDSHNAPWPSRILGRDLQSREAECYSQGSRAHTKGRRNPSFEVSGSTSQDREAGEGLHSVLSMESPVVEPRLCPFSDQNLQKWCWSYFSVTHMCVSRSVVSDSLRTHGLQPARLLCPRDSPGKHTGVGCHFLLQVICVSQC